MRATFTLAIFVGSFLLFLVQPLAARLILPTFGGTPSVWSASLVFFQGVLLLGYGYAHLTRKLAPRTAVVLHLGLFVLAALTLPFSTQTGLFRSVQAALGTTQTPEWLVLGALGVLVGLPYFIVSAGAPMLQRWFSQTDDPAADDPYFLYAASNVGSMLALLTYPFVVEPRLRLDQQTTLWTIGYGVLAVAILATAAFQYRSAPAESTALPGQTPPIRFWQWVLLAAVPSSLLSGVTSYVSLNIAPIPLLWVVPLSLYLLSFILAFRARPFLSTAVLSRLMPLVVVPIVVLVLMEQFQPQLGVFHVGAFLVCAWMCHQRLYDLRPEAAELTRFYFAMSLGGVLGGAFNALLAPNIFITLAEYPIALAAVGLLRLPHKPEWTPTWRDPAFAALVFGVVFAAVRFANSPAFEDFSRWFNETLGAEYSAVRTLSTIGLGAVLAFLASDRPIRFGLTVGAVFLAAAVAGLNATGTVLTLQRSFFGTYRVSTTSGFDRFVNFVHGNTLHGRQDRQNPGVPLTYYHPTGPIGKIFTQLSGPNAPEHVALVGLGVGSLAAYGKPGQRVTFYEIDPLVRDIAQNPRYFSFLSNAQAETDVVIGDARITLEKAPDGEFGLIVLDAFSSDAIPVHLLTREAMAMYQKKLTPGGAIAYHISNRYLNLEPIVAANAKALGMRSFIFEDTAMPAEAAEGKTASSWMVVLKDPASLGDLLNEMGDWREADADPNVEGWTDDFSNVLSVFSTSR